MAKATRATRGRSSRQTGGSSVIAKLKKKGMAKAHNAHKGDPLEMPRGGTLPAGIENGVGLLTQAEFGEYDSGNNKGEPYAIFGGTAQEPASLNGTPVKGARLNKMIPLCDTDYSTFDDQWAKLLNELRKMEVPTEDLDAEDVEQAMKDLVEEETHFRFRTWQGRDSDYVNLTLMGAVEYEGGKEDEVTSEDEEEVEEEGDDDEEEEGDDSEISLQDLGDMADEEGDDSDAAAQLTAKAEEAEIDPNEYSTWAEVAAALLEGEGEEEGEDEGEDAGPPEKGDIRVYDGVEVEVQKVNKRAQTADVMDIESEDVWEGVEWAELTVE